MCSWTVIETIHFFNSHSMMCTDVFIDLSKAFDLVDFRKGCGSPINNYLNDYNQTQVRAHTIEQRYVLSSF